MKLNVRVTKNDILTGKCGNVFTCAVAAAGTRALRRRKGFKRSCVSVGSHEAGIARTRRSEDTWTAHLSKKTRRFIANFDAIMDEPKKDQLALRKKLKPFTLKLNFRELPGA